MIIVLEEKQKWEKSSAKKNKRKKSKLVMSTKNSTENSIYKHLVHSEIGQISNCFIKYLLGIQSQRETNNCNFGSILICTDNQNMHRDKS